jgi:HK97 family phage portal protein
MAFWSGWRRGNAVLESNRVEPQMASQSIGGGITISTAQELDDYLKTGSATASGARVTADSAMRVGAVYACVRIRAGIVATLPIDVKRRVDARTREDASDTKLGLLLRRKPNRWQTPSQFRRMMQAHHMLRGNAYAMIVRSMFGTKEVLELVPLHPDRVKVCQLENLALEFVYTRKNGGTVTLKQSEVFHLAALTLDGFTGVTPLTYARETIGLSLAMEQHGATVFKNGARISTVLRHPGKLGQEGLDFLKASLDEYRSGGESEGKALILEEGMEVSPLAMTMEDALWIEGRKFSRTDIAMFFGVPPHMIGDTDKSTSWGTGIEAQTQGFLTFTAEDDLTMWEEAIGRDLIVDPASALYARFNRAALVQADIKNRTAAYASGLQWGWLSPNEVRALEDRNPRDGGDDYYDPPNTAGTPATSKQEDEGNEPAPAP